MTWWASSTPTPFSLAMDLKMISGKDGGRAQCFNMKIIFLLKGHFNICNFRALQLVHSVVLDTSAVFPHYCGLPYRRSLRSLVSSYLKVIMAMLSNSDRRKQLLCFHCSIGPLLKTFICSVRSSPHGATTPMRMLGPVSISCSGRPGDHFSHPFLNQNDLLKQNLSQ